MPMPRNTLMTIQPIKTKPKAGIWYLSVKCMVLLPAWLIYMGFMQLLWQEYYWSSASLHHWTMATGFVVWFPSGTGLGQSWHFSDVMIIQLWITMKNSDMYDTWLTMSSSPVKNFFQCSKEVAVDERMVRSKHRSGMRQYNKNKPTKWGLKLWVLADSDTGYTYNFNV